MRIGTMAEDAVAKSEEFRTYVHEGVVHYLNQSKEDAEQERAGYGNSTESTE
jgi:hypothetical protein